MHDNTLAVIASICMSWMNSLTFAPYPWRVPRLRLFGEVSERLKEHAWKVCIRQRIEGSNPSLSAILEKQYHYPGRGSNPRFQ